jgi:serine/threonine protein phosphatase PrpC
VILFLVISKLINEVIELKNIGMLSIKGKVRENDEDSILCVNLKRGGGNSDTGGLFCALADGMGGGERGEIASSLAINVASKYSTDLILGSSLDENLIKDKMMKIVEESNDEIKKYRKEHNIENMGTTLTAALISKDQLFVVNIGDSRTYLIASDGKIRKKTKDHSYVQELVDNGFLTEDKIRDHPKRNLVTRIIDGEIGNFADFYHWQIFKGDTVLLCCDGFWEPLSDEFIGKSLSSDEDPQLIAESMAELANDIDGSDNISLIIIKPDIQLNEKEYIESKTVKFEKKMGN